MKRVFLLFFTVLLFAAAAFPQYTSQPKFRGYRASDPASCARTGERYWNTATLAETYCTATGSPGTWAAVGGGASIGGTVTSATEGSVFFAGASGVLAQDNAGFFYNNATNQLRLTAGAATDTPLKVTLAAAQTADAFQVFASDGTTKYFAVSGATPSVTAPQLNFGTATTGIRGTSNAIYFDYSGVTRNTFDFANNAQRFDSTGQIGWSNTSADPNATNDIGIGRYAVGVMKITDVANGIKSLLGGGAAVASATALPLPTGRVFHVTGTTTITSITATNLQSGVCITLIFDSTAQISDGNNLKLAGDFTGGADRTLTLVYDSANWYETARSVN